MCVGRVTSRVLVTTAIAIAITTARPARAGESPLEPSATEPAEPPAAPRGLDDRGWMVALMPGVLSVYPDGPELAARYGLLVGALLRPRSGPGSRLALGLGGQLEHVVQLSELGDHESFLRLSGAVRLGRAAGRSFVYGTLEVGGLLYVEKLHDVERIHRDLAAGLTAHGGGGVLGTLTPAFFVGAELTGGVDLVMKRSSVDAHASVQLRALVGVLF